MCKNIRQQYPITAEISLTHSLVVGRVEILHEQVTAEADQVYGDVAIHHCRICCEFPEGISVSIIVDEVHYVGNVQKETVAPYADFMAALAFAVPWVAVNAPATLKTHVSSVLRYRTRVTSFTVIDTYSTVSADKCRLLCLSPHCYRVRCSDNISTSEIF